jgi:hypothetical protein
MDTPSSPLRFRFRALVWDAPGRGHQSRIGDLLESGYVEAADLGTALTQIPLAQLGDDVVRLVVDLQRAGISPWDKIAEGSPWRVSVIWLQGQADQIDRVRQHVERALPRAVVAVDDAGNLGIAAGLPSILECEAMDDLEEALEQVLGDRVYESLGGVETGILDAPPSENRLRAELIEAAQHPVTRAFPPGPAPHLEETEAEGPADRELICELLLKVAAGEESAPEVLAVELGISPEAVSQAQTAAEQWGLALPPAEGEGAMLLHAGEQFLTRHGRVAADTLEFLASSINDLNSREALRRAGTILIDELLDAFAGEHAVEHAQELVPPGFREAVDRPLAARLFAAASALIARLADGHAAGCVAEEIVTVRLLEIAEQLLAENEQAIGEAATAHAIDELRGIFELFQDDDVLQMYEMAEPADAAIAGQSSVNRQLGVADQRIEAWFDAFGGTVVSGHLNGPMHRWP